MVVHFGKFRRIQNFHRIALSLCEIRREIKWKCCSAHTTYRSLVIPKFRAKNGAQSHRKCYHLNFDDGFLENNHNRRFLQIERIIDPKKRPSLTRIWAKFDIPIQNFPKNAISDVKFDEKYDGNVAEPVRPTILELCPNFRTKMGTRALRKWCYLHFDDGFEFGDLENPHNHRFLQIERIP